MSDAEWDLIQQCRGGRTSAFAPLVAAHQGDALAVAESYLLDPDDAADAVQEAFVRAYANLGRLARGSAVGPWFRTILRNLCLDLLKSPARRGRETIDSISEHPVVTPSALEQLERADLTRAVRTALRRLPAAHREVLVLKEVEGMNYAEIARTLGIPAGTVASRIFHARVALRKDLLDAGITTNERDA